MLSQLDLGLTIPAAHAPCGCGSKAKPFEMLDEPGNGATYVAVVCDRCGGLVKRWSLA